MHARDADRPARALTVVFDLDDTLCNDSGARAEALRAIGATLGEPGRSLLQAWTEIEPPLLRAFLRGDLSLAAYRLQRFALPLQRAGFPMERAASMSDALNAEYMRRCNEEVCRYDDALPALERLRAHGAALALLTDGPSDGQRTKLRCLGLEGAFDAVFISGETGHGKPDPCAFTQVEGALPARKLVMVGDSVRRDIRPALDRGWSAALLRRRPTDSPAPEGAWVVAGLSEAVDRILSWAGARRSDGA